MKTKAYTVRLNLEVEKELELYNHIEITSKNYKSASEYIKTVLIDQHSKEESSIEEVIRQSQKEMIDQIYDVCLKIISAIGGVSTNTTVIAERKENELPEATEEFPDDLSRYKMIIHCGGCTLNEKEMKYRINKAKEEYERYEVPYFIWANIKLRSKRPHFVKYNSFEFLTILLTI